MTEASRLALDAIEAQLDEMRSLKGWRMNLIRENCAKLRAALDTAEPLAAGTVSVELLQMERAVSDDLREQNAKLRASHRSLAYTDALETIKRHVDSALGWQEGVGGYGGNGLKRYATRDLISERLLASLTATSPAEAKPWECMGRKQSLPEPGECDWPYCGCDPHATKVIESLLEQGWVVPAEATPVQVRAPVETFIAELHDQGLIVSRAAFAAVEKLRVSLAQATGGENG